MLICTVKFPILVKKVNVEDGMNLIKPKAKFRSNLKKLLSFQLSKINGTVPGIVDNKIRDLSILISGKSKNVGQKRNCKTKIIDIVHVKCLQNFESQAKTLNPVDIDIEHEKVRTLVSI